MPSRQIHLILCAAGLVFLALAAACASEPAQPEKTSGAPTLEERASTPSPETPLEEGPVKNAQPGLAPGEPTPTPEARPPAGGQEPEPGLVQTLVTAPRTVTLQGPGDAALRGVFYPAPQPGAPALLLLAAADEDEPWKLLAQTAQVRGLAALVLESPAPASSTGVVQAAAAWLAAPENGAFKQIVTAGSGPLALIALAGLQENTGTIRAALLFSPPAAEVAAELKQTTGPVLLVRSDAEAAASALPESPNLTMIAGPNSGLQALVAQPGLLKQVIDWCLLHSA